MAKQLLGRGSSANDGTGDNLRDGANKINLNFNEIYTAIGDGTTIDGTIKIADDSSTVMTLSANGETTRILGGTAVTTTISGNDLTIALDTSAVVTAVGTTTLTNKTIALGSNTVSGTTAQFNTALTDGSFATLAGSEALTNKDLTGSGNTFPTITMIDDSSTTDAVSLGENFRFTGGTGISSTLGSNAVTFAIDNTVATLAGSQTLTNKTIVAGNNTISGITNAMLSGSAGITNANLANSTITIGDDAISLGGTQTTITNLSLDGATGTIDLTSSGNKLRFNFANLGSFPTASTYEGMFAYDIGGNNPYVADAGGWVKILSENSSISDLSNVGSIASISNGQALIWNSAAGRFDPGNAGGFSAGSDLDQANATVQDVGYLSYRSSSVTPTKTLTVTVASQTSEHYYNGTGSGNKYVIDGDQGPFLSLAPGIYRFDQADGSNSGHPLLFYRDPAKATAYTTGVSTNGTPGSAGAYTQITIDKDTPQVIYYQCSAHGYMGHAIQTVGSEANANTSLSYSLTTDTGDGTTTPIGSITSGFSVNEVIVTVNGLILEPTTDYTISGTTLTFAVAPASGAELTVRYLDNTSGSYSTQAFAGDGSTTRTISSGRNVNDILVSVNGILLVPGTDYSISGTTLTFATAPATGAEISIRYLRLT